MYGQNEIDLSISHGVSLIKIFQRLISLLVLKCVLSAIF